MDRDTIVALSTPLGESGIAVVRMSGPESIDILASMVPESRKWTPRKIYHCILRDAAGEPLDDVVAVVMRAPASYTGEDMVEISCHGGYQVVTDIIEEIISRGAREAGHGEFTKRAFVNGRLDLSQAEAVADLIAAETRLQRVVAIEHLEGHLSKIVRKIEQDLLSILSFIEVSIDFSEENMPVYDREDAVVKLEKIASKLDDLISSEAAGRNLRQGIRITILGPRNAGKSSLYNALIGEERAIVSSVPGTTRDLLRERIHIGGFTFYLEDTAGLADTGCEVEAKGISLGREAASKAEIVLFVIDGSVPFEKAVRTELLKIGPDKTILVVNKLDLPKKVKRRELEGLVGDERIVEVSALEGKGLDELRNIVYEHTAKKGASRIGTERVAVNARQGAALKEARDGVVNAVKRLEEGSPDEIVSVEVRSAIDACGKVTGRSVSEDLLDVIFNRFCVGK